MGELFASGLLDVLVEEEEVEEEEEVLTAEVDAVDVVDDGLPFGLVLNISSSSSSSPSSSLSPLNKEDFAVDGF